MTTTTVLNDHQVKVISKIIAADWEDVAYELGLEHNDVRRIKRDSSFPELSDKAAEMLFLVREKSGQLLLEDILAKLNNMEKRHDAKLVEEAIRGKQKGPEVPLAQLHLTNFIGPPVSAQAVKDTQSPTPDGVLDPAAFIFGGGINGLLKQSRRQLGDGDPVLKSILPAKRNVEGAGSPLAGPQFDLATMDMFLRTTCQVQIYKKSVCLSDAKAKDKEEILDIMRRLINSPRNTKVIYFSGHGDETAGSLQLGNNLQISFDEVFAMWKNRDRHDDVLRYDRAKEKLVVICDSCFSGQWVDRVMEKRASEDEDAKKMFVQASCQGDETSTDFDNGAMFTRTFMSQRALAFHSGKSSRGPSTKEEFDKEEKVVRKCGHHPRATVPNGTLTQLVELSQGITIGLVDQYWTPMIRERP